MDLKNIFLTLLAGVCTLALRFITPEETKPVTAPTTTCAPARVVTVITPTDTVSVVATRDTTIVVLDKKASLRRNKQQ